MGRDPDDKRDEETRAADEESSDVYVRKDTLALLLGQLDEERRARVAETVAREDREHKLREAAEERHARIIHRVLLIVTLLIVGLLAVVGVYVTVGFPGGGSVEASPEVDVDVSVPGEPQPDP